VKKNVLFILIDGLRADQVYDNERKSYTPFLDSLRDKGIYFENTFVPGDGTHISLNCLFNSKFQFETGIRAKKIILLEDNHIAAFKKQGYSISGLIPKLTSFNSIKDYLENENCTYDSGPPPETLFSGMIEKISNLLNSLKNKSPWFCYIHLFDLHPLKEGRIPKNINEFESEKFGDSLYSKTVSSIDHGLKKILENIDLKNTILVITADHGDKIPYGEKFSFQFEPELKTATSLGRTILPKSTHKVTGKILGQIKKGIGKRKSEYYNQNLTPYQKRSREPYFTLSLHDEILHVPFFINNTDLPKKIISNQISNLDIFPTLFELLEIPFINTKYSSSLVPLINGNNISEREIFLHTIPYEEESSLDRMGLRTSKYKYFRNSRDENEDVTLYDLENDPFENNNIAKNESKIVIEMENMLKEMKKDFGNLKNTSDEDEVIKEELKKLGYL
tara:strand:- start:18624 stop:19967 length:1344 start_codon:yes stop_codon:yes gene_type:complete